MKKVFVIYNASTDCYGMPFVCDGVQDAMKAVCGTVSPKDWATTLACSCLCVLGSYDDKIGQLVKVKKKVVATSEDLLGVAAQYCDNVVGVIADAISSLDILKDFYTEVKQNGTCTQEG